MVRLQKIVNKKGYGAYLIYLPIDDVIGADFHKGDEIKVLHRDNKILLIKEDKA